MTLRCTCAWFEDYRISHEINCPVHGTPREVFEVSSETREAIVRVMGGGDVFDSDAINEYVRERVEAARGNPLPLARFRKGKWP